MDALYNGGSTYCKLSKIHANRHNISTRRNIFTNVSAHQNITLITHVQDLENTLQEAHNTMESWLKLAISQFDCMIQII